MYAIIDIAGHQQRVQKDQVFLTDLTGTEVGKELTSDKVVFIGGSTPKVGKPYVSGAKVKLKVLEEIKSPKIHGFRYRKRKGTKRTWGHRTRLHKLQVIDITG